MGRDIWDRQNQVRTTTGPAPRAGAPYEDAAGESYAPGARCYLRCWWDRISDRVVKCRICGRIKRTER